MMRNEFTNLLPRARIQALKREYAIRLAVVALWFIAALALIAGILLVPTYMFLGNATAEKQARLVSLRSSLSLKDESSLAKRLAVLAENASSLTALSEANSMSSLLRSVLQVAHPGVALTGFSYTPPEGAHLASFAITGIAANRTALRNYQVALENAPFASSAALPVSAFAQDRDITFKIQVALQP